MALTTAQRAALRTDINNSTDPAVIAARGNGADIGRDDTTLVAIYNANAAGPVKAWRTDVSSRDLFESMNITKYDSIAQSGKREAWRLMLDFAPVDFTRNKNRKAVTDIWGATDAAGILNDCLENASRAEVLFGGSNATESTVSGLVRNWVGDLTIEDMGRAMNEV